MPVYDLTERDIKIVPQNFQIARTFFRYKHEGFKRGLANDYHLKYCIFGQDSKTRLQEVLNGKRPGIEIRVLSNQLSWVEKFFSQNRSLRI